MKDAAFYPGRLLEFIRGNALAVVDHAAAGMSFLI